MAMLPQAANTEDNHSTGGFDVVPSGVYEVALRMAEMRENKAGTGQYLYMEFVITEGEYKGSVLFERLNLLHPNATAVRIANQKLNQICAAAKKANVEDTDDLLNIPIEATVETTATGDEQYPTNTEIKKFEHLEGEAFDGGWD